MATSWARSVLQLGIWLQFGLVVGLVSWLAVGLVVGLVSWLAVGLVVGLGSWIGLGIVRGFDLGRGFSGCGDHMVTRAEQSLTRLPGSGTNVDQT